MIKAFNQATKKFSDYFTYIEKELDKPSRRIEENLTYFNSQLVLWHYDEEYSDKDFETLFIKRFNSTYRICNFMNREIAIKHKENIFQNTLDFDIPLFLFEYLLSFLMNSKNYLKENQYNVIILHDELINTKIFFVVSALLMYIQDKHPNPIEIFKDIHNFNPSFAELMSKTDLEYNSMRYLNYINQITSNPIVDIKQLFLKYIIINGSPAIDNKQNTVSSPYLTIDDHSYYSPIIRLKANGKVIYCSFNKNKPVHQVLYSDDAVAKFDSNCFLFGDIVIDVLHKGEGKFRLLFSIQFNTFFITETCIRFEKKDIDSIHKDIRYPHSFGVDLMFDSLQEKKLSAYDEESVNWKTLISDFIVKGNFKKITKINSDSMKQEDEIKEDVLMNNSLNTTMNQVQELLEKMNTKEEENKRGDSNEGEDEDNDIDDYIQNLEKKAK